MGDFAVVTNPFEPPKLLGGFKVELGQMMNEVSVTFRFEVDADADTFFDWLASQPLDSGRIVIAFNASNMRVG